jgi:hypothetical protein
MKSLARIAPLFILLIAAQTGFVACGSTTDGGGASGGTSSNAGKGSTNGGGGASSAGTHNSGGDGSALTCPSSECGPALGVPNTVCADGSTGGPTGRCLRLDTGGCGWEVRVCPPAGEGGTTSTGGTAGAASGGAASGGAASGGAANGGATNGGAANGGAANAGEGGAAPFTDRCGGCKYDGATPEICIFQAGGPGPGRFVCATQNPCGAAGACVCIVGQGACNPALEGGSPGYCVCDNGLD